MAKAKKENLLVSLMISLPKEIRDNLRKMAAQMNLENQNEVTSAAQIARKIIIENFQPTSN